jgi:CRISPR-associated protein Cmr2
MNKKTYIALTLGPIYRTLGYAKKVKGLWAASYLFSYLAKELVKPFKTANFFILPDINNDKLWDPANGAGLFPDRFIFEAKDGDFDKLAKHIDETVSSLAEKIALIIVRDKNEIHNYLKNYLKIYFIEYKTNRSETENVIEKLEQKLSLLEQQDSFNSLEKDNFLEIFFEKIDGNSFLATDAFDNTITKRLFNSLIEISAAEEHDFVSSQVLQNVQEQAIFNDLKNQKKYKSYFRYIAIVKADGDNMGNAIAALYEKGMGLNELDKRILNFNLVAVNKIKSYGGMPIYLGGDDLLFFAPLKYHNKNIFNLIDELNTAFTNAMSELPVNPTISFGIAMAYYRTPLLEILLDADDLLNNKAKKVEGKNALAFSFQKHSGQSIDATIPKGIKPLYSQFLQMFSFIDNENKGEEKFLSSVMHWLGKNEMMLNAILPQENLLANYFDNSFNESVHEKYRPFLKNVQNMLLAAYFHTINTQKSIKQVYATLRFIHFLNSTNDEQ